MTYQRASHIRPTPQSNSRNVISDKKAARYFARSASTPRWVKIILLISITLCVISITFHFYMLSALLLLPALFCLLVMYRIHRTNTTDDEYDAWLEQKERELRQRGYQLHSIPTNYPVSSVLSIKSFVPRGSITSHMYARQDVQMKKGKDGNWRYSITVCTYFFPMRRGMAIFKSDINVFHTQQHRDERHETYPYSFLTTATTDSEDDRVVIDHVTYRYQTDQLYLVFSNGAMSSFSAVVQAHLIDATNDAPYSVVPNAMFDVKLNALRALLLSDGKSTQLQS